MEGVREEKEVEVEEGMEGRKQREGVQGEKNSALDSRQVIGGSISFFSAF